MLLSEHGIAVDTHTHTIHSGHAWSTLSENASAAAQRGLYGLCLTEHGPDTPGSAPEIVPSTQFLLPKTIRGVRVYSGIEANILDETGRLDVSTACLKRLDMAVASLHTMCMDCSDAQANTRTYLAVLQNPYIDILGHIHQSAAPCDLRRVIRAAADAGRVVELNSAYLIPERKNDYAVLVQTIELCRDCGAEVSVSSDAHFCDRVGDVGDLLRLMDTLHFPASLVVNLSPERFEALLRRRKERIAGC